MIFLSATLPNAFEFAEWVAHIHGLPCHMVSTSRRPTPLVHFGLPVGGDGLFLLVDERGNFNPTNFQKLQLSLKNDSSENLKNGSVPTDQETAKDQGNGGMSKKRRIQASIEDDLMRLIHVIHNRQLFPVVIFSFSRR